MNPMSDEQYDADSVSTLERPWIVLGTTHDVEAWIDNFNRELQLSFFLSFASGYGICFRLAEGGEIFMHTTAEGEVLLEVTQEAEWAAPVICAATGIAAPRSRIWRLPGDTLTQFLLGLSMLIASTRMELDHDFKLKKSEGWR